MVMSMQIKCRAWDGENKIMFTDPYEVFGCLMRAIPWPDAYTHFKFLQYTGLKDRNGREIYDGDIISIRILGKFALDMDIKAVIEREAGAFWFRGVDHNITDCNWHHYNASDRQVIGNIYENTELLFK